MLAVFNTIYFAPLNMQEQIKDLAMFWNIVTVKDIDRFLSCNLLTMQYFQNKDIELKSETLKGRK